MRGLIACHPNARSLVYRFSEGGGSADLLTIGIAPLTLARWQLFL